MRTVDDGKMYIARSRHTVGGFCAEVEKKEIEIVTGFEAQTAKPITLAQYVIWSKFMQNLLVQ